MIHWNWWAWGLLALLVFWGIGAYNRVMLLRNAIGAAFAQFDEALTRRIALGEQLVTQLRPILPSEQASYDTLATAQEELRTQLLAARGRPYAADPVAQLAVSTAVHAAALTRLVSLVEHQVLFNPDPSLSEPLDELKLVERQRAFARQVFNQAVGAYNEALQQFPTRVLTSFFSFREARTL